MGIPLGKHTRALPRRPATRKSRRHRLAPLPAGRRKESRELLKLKTQYDAEAKIVRKHGKRDSWWASTFENGTLFKLASGGDRGRVLEPGAVVTYRYWGVVHADGVPRFPSIGRIHPAACACCAACRLGEEEWPVSPWWRVAGNGLEVVARGASG